MRVIIAGGRDFDEKDRLYAVLDSAPFPITEVICGGARGADDLGRCWANDRGIPVKEFIPDWSTGKSAGFIRNAEMAKNADILVAFWDGKSKGTSQMITKAQKENLIVFIFEY